MNPQKYIIKFMLEKGNWICGTEFLKEHIPEYRSRINEIRKEGIMVETRRCKIHSHKGNLQMWRWATESRQTQNLAISEELAQKTKYSMSNPILAPNRLFQFNSAYQD